MATKRISQAEIKRRVRQQLADDKVRHLKTAVMWQLELEYGLSILVLLDPKTGDGATLADKYGVSESVVSKWRTRLGIQAPAQHRFSKEN